MHDLPLITTIAAGFFSAWVLGLIALRIGLSPIVGYLLAGIIIGPHTPGFVGDIHLAQQLAEIGVILLMFGVGLHFHLEDLFAVKWIAIPGAVGQSLVATLLGVLVFHALGLGMTAGLVMGMAISVASTVVLIRVLQDNNKLESPSGHAAVGWLIVEDIFTVIALVLLPVLGAEFGAGTVAAAEGGKAGANLWSALLWSLVNLSVLVGIVLLAGSRVIPGIIVHVAKLRSRELFTLTVLVLSIAIAAASYSFFGASMALGAFLAGMVVGQSPVSHQAASDALPLRDAFAVLFFVSVGMLFDPHAIINEPLLILAALGITLIAKPLAALVIVAVLGQPLRTGLVIALALAQIGEFSFILSELARREGLMPEVGHSVLVAAAIISISINPFIFRLRVPIEMAARKRPWLWKILNGRAEKRLKERNTETVAKIAALTPEEKKKTAVVVGFGFVGQSVCRLLRKAGFRTVIIDMNMETVAVLNANSDAGQIAVYGDAKNIAVLAQAGVRDAAYLLVTMAKSENPAQIILQARDLNPDICIMVRSRYVGERDLLIQAGATDVAFEEAEIAIAMGRTVLSEIGRPPEDFADEMELIRKAVSTLPGGVDAHSVTVAEAEEMEPAQ